MSYFTADLARTMHQSSVRVYLNAVRNLHNELDTPYSTVASALLTRVLRGIARSPSMSRTRLPITTPLLRRLYASHLFRIRAATSAAMADEPEWRI